MITTTNQKHSNQTSASMSPPPSGELEGVTLGMRNSNPLNIRNSGSRWQGATNINTKEPFVKFSERKYGYRAAFCLLHTYMTKYRCNTIEAIVRRWAPPTENVTENYIRFVSQRSNIPRKQTLAFSEKRLMCRIVEAMAEYESKITDDAIAIDEGYDLAGFGN